MDTEIQCISLNGASLDIAKISVDSDKQCEVKFEADINECNSNRNEFLRLAYYDEGTNCFSLDGIDNNKGTMGDSIATHLTPYYYVDYIPDDYNADKFKVIWGFLIALHILFDILIFFSCLSCIVFHRKDF